MDSPATRIWEQTLVVRCQTGDHNALTDLMRIYHRRLAYYVRSLAGQMGDPEDILQDVWLEVYLKVHKLRNPEAFRVWLYRLARDKVYGVFRRNRITTVEFHEEDPPPDLHEEPAFSEEEVEHLNLALQKLDFKHREVLVLKFMEDMSYDEIAESLGCPLGTVRSRIYYAKRALRRQMEEEL